MYATILIVADEYIEDSQHLPCFSCNDVEMMSDRFLEWNGKSASGVWSKRTILCPFMPGALLSVQSSGLLSRSCIMMNEMRIEVERQTRMVPQDI